MSLYEYFYLYKKPNLDETGGIPTQDFVVYTTEDFPFDMYLNVMGCYRTDSKIHFYKPKTGEEVWDVFSSLKSHLDKHYNKNEWFVHTGANGSCIIQLTSLKDKPQ